MWLLLWLQPPSLSGQTWTDGVGVRFKPFKPAAPSAQRLTLLSNSALGIHFTNALSLPKAMANNNLMNGAGVAAGDFDGDGLCDVFFCNLDGRSALLRNLGGWRFEDATDRAGVACTHQASTGAAFADLNGDGTLDLLVTSCGGPNTCFFNDGHGHFTDVTAAAGFLSKAGSTSIALADIDGDGDLDVYIANYADLSILRSGGALNLRRVNGQLTVVGPYAKRIRVVNDKMIELGEPDVLYLNDGKGHFTPASWTDGTFLDDEGHPLTAPPEELGLSAMFHDLNGDGAPDLYVCNDYDGPDRVWINDGKGHFRALPKLAMRTSSQFSMSVDIADIDRDGHYDIFVVDMLSRVHALRMTQMGVLDPPPRVIGRFDDRPQIRRNTLFQNRGDHTYAEIANAAGVAASDWTWCAAFLDVDLDGYEDLLTANGHAFDIQDIDAMESIQHRGKPSSLEESHSNLLVYPKLLTPNYAFKNLGGKRFEEQGKAWGFDSTQVSHGIALADLDNDGDLDVVVSCLNSPPLLYRNESTEARVAIRLKGAGANTAGIGASIRVTGGPVFQSQEIIAGGRYVSCDQAMRVFAAGSDKASLTLEVLWRDGRMSRLEGAKPNSLYEFDESGSIANPADPKPKKASAPFFSDVSQKLDHRHSEEPFNDFERQPLLPRRLSQTGPGITWFDFDQDGHEDLIIPSGKGGQLAGFRNLGRGRFIFNDAPPFSNAASADQTTALGWATSEGNTFLAVGRSQYEGGNPQSPSALLYHFAGGKLKDSGRLPGIPSSTGPMVLADFDGDGDLDLFIGGRVIPGRYPSPANSRIFLNHQGNFGVDTNAIVFQSVGLVSAAVSSDLDSDGVPELILACEWGAIRVFSRQKDGWHEITEALGLAPFKGWWNGVTTADVDGDGRMDIVASNWGLNSSYNETPQKPVQLYYGDFTGDGSTSILESETDPVTQALMPRRDLIVMGAVWPQLRSVFNSHQAYSTASVTTFPGFQSAESNRVSASYFHSTVFLNRGARFIPKPLPDEAQWAPAFGIAAGDFDGDGNEDLFLSQNFFDTAPDVPRLDAGRGLWLRGDGKGGFDPVSGTESGILIYGEQRGAALCDFDEDGRWDLAVGQSGAQTRLFQNLKGKPGLRVRLIGPNGNRNAIGSQLQLRSPMGNGPTREIHTGSGYLSQDSSVQIMTSPTTPSQLWVRWPGGKETVREIPAGAKELTIDFSTPGGAGATP